jgi:hypothetical protein
MRRVVRLLVAYRSRMITTTEEHNPVDCHRQHDRCCGLVVRRARWSTHNEFEHMNFRCVSSGASLVVNLDRIARATPALIPSLPRV